MKDGNTNLSSTHPIIGTTQLAILSLIFTTFCFAIPSFGASYYVRADGTAGNKSSATGCGAQSTSMNIGTSNNQTFAAGDRIVLCNNGGIFRATLEPSWNTNGAPGQPVIYDGRGTAVFSGADLVTGWSQDGGNVYKAQIQIKPEQVFINGQFGDRKDGRWELVNERDWYWESGSLYLYTNSGDPDNAFTQPGVEASARDFSIRVFDNDHITIDGVTAHHAQQNGVEVIGDSDFFTIRNSILEWNYLEGIRKNAWNGVSHDNGLIEDNTVRMNGSVGILVNTDHKDNVIRRNVIYENGTHQQTRHTRQLWTGGIKLWSQYETSRVLVEDNKVYKNGKPGGDFGQGVGIWIDMCSGQDGANVIRNNLVYENYSFGVFVEKSSNTVVAYNVVIDNAEIHATAGIGVKSSEEAVGVNNFIHNNTIIGSKYYGLLCAVYDAGEYPRLYDTTFTNNIAVGSAIADLRVENACANDGYYGSGNTYQYNSFGSERQNFISWDHTYMSSYDQWEAAYGQPTFSIRSDPEFESNENRELWLRPSSPAIDSGLNLGIADGKGLDQSSAWPNGVSELDQDQFGNGWELGAYVHAVTPGGGDDIIFMDGFTNGDFSGWLIFDE